MTDFNDVLAVDTKRASAISQVDRDRMLEAMHALEEATARPALAQSDVWTHAVRMALDRLESAFAEQRSSYEDPMGLMAEIAHDDPRLRTLVRQLLDTAGRNSRRQHNRFGKPSTHRPRRTRFTRCASECAG